MLPGLRMVTPPVNEIPFTMRVPTVGRPVTDSDSTDV